MLSLVLFCIPVGSTDCLVCDTAFGMQHTIFLGVMCHAGVISCHEGMCYLVQRNQENQ